MTPRSSKLPMLALFVGIAILVATISAQANDGAFVRVDGQAGDSCIYTTPGWSID